MRNPFGLQFADYFSPALRAWLAAQGVRALRFSVEELEQRPAVVLAAIKEAAER